MIRISPVQSVVAVVLVGLLLAGAWKIHAYGQDRYAAGQADTKAEWDASIERGKKEIDRLRAAANKVSTKVVTRYIDRVKVVREKSDAIVQQVPVYLPAGSGLLPGGFRLLHDAGSANQPVPSGTDPFAAASVPAETAAATVLGNYGTYHQVAARLTALQDWVYAQCLKNPPPEGCVAPYD